MESIRWFHNLSHLLHKFLDNLSRNGCQPARAGFISVHTGDIANIGIDPNALARSSTLVPALNNHREMFFLEKNEEIDVAYV